MLGAGQWGIATSAVAFPFWFRSGGGGAFWVRFHLRRSGGGVGEWWESEGLNWVTLQLK